MTFSADGAGSDKKSKRRLNMLFEIAVKRCTIRVVKEKSKKGERERRREKDREREGEMEIKRKS